MPNVLNNGMSNCTLPVFLKAYLLGQRAIDGRQLLKIRPRNKSQELFTCGTNIFPVPKRVKFVKMQLIDLFFFSICNQIRIGGAKYSI